MLLELLTETEKGQFEDAVSDWNKEYCNAHSNHRASVETILSPWAEAKKSYLYDLLGKNLILSKDFDYSISLDELIGEMERELNQHIFLQRYREYVYSGVLDVDCDARWALSELAFPDNLVKNVWKGPDIKVHNPKDGKPYTVKKGCKIVKALGKMAEMFDLKDFEDFRIKHSQILNSKHLTGKLNISIHPLDYATMSDNECGWASCMSWWNGGEYAQGTIEMMNSPCVVVAYLTSSSDMNFGRGKWNNKKWRELFIIDKYLITEVMAYPYANEDLTREVLRWLKDLAKKNLGWEYCEEPYLYSPDESSYAVGDYTVEFITDYMYNDFRDEHLMYISPDAPKNISCHYSGDSECMWCGDTVIEISDEGRLICEECSGAHKCSCCGDYVYNEDYLYCFDGEYYCSCCYPQAIKECSLCYEMHHIDDLKQIYILSEDGSRYTGDIAKYTPAYICPDCDLETLRDKYLKTKGTIYKIQPEFWYIPVYGIKVSELNDAGRDLFFEGRDENEMTEKYLFAYRYEVYETHGCITDALDSSNSN